MKPIPSYQVYKGVLFELVDHAVVFVMGKIDRAVGTRALGNEAPVTYEIPRDAVAEAIVNAIAHRDYASNASVQVMLFSDRLEVWNPGHLPPSLTFDALRRPHASVPHNPLIAEPLFLTRLVERAGSGILDMIALCAEAGLPAPEFRQDAGSFVQTLIRPVKQVLPQVVGEVGTETRQSGMATQSDDGKHQAHDEAHEPISLSEHRIMTACLASPQSSPELLTALGYAARTGNFKRGLKHLIDLNMLEMSMPESPRSKNQKYRLTEKGRAWLAKARTGKQKPS